jgi:hypothetical protein
MNHSSNSSKVRHLLLFFFFPTYNLGFHLRTLMSKSPRDETLTLVFKILQEAQETLVTPRERERDQVQMKI